MIVKSQKYLLKDWVCDILVKKRTIQEDFNVFGQGNERMELPFSERRKNTTGGGSELEYQKLGFLIYQA